MKVSKLFHNLMIDWMAQELDKAILDSEDLMVHVNDRYKAAIKADIWQKMIEMEQGYRLTFSRESAETKKFKVVNDV